MKTKVFLSSIAIATLLGTAWSCSSDVEEIPQTSVKRTVVRNYSPEVLIRAHELGITVENDYLHRNLLTEEDKRFFLDLLEQGGDSVFHHIYSTPVQPLKAFSRLKRETKEESGSTVHSKQWSNSWEKSEADMKYGEIKYKIYIGVTWSIVDGKASNALGTYAVSYIA